MCRHLNSTKRAKALATSQPLFVLKGRVPEEGWNSANFTGRAALELNRDLTNVQRFSRLKGSRVLSVALKAMFEDQITRVIEGAILRATRIYGVSRDRSAKADIVLPADAHAGLWADALETELLKAGIEVTVTVAPAIQIAAGETYRKTGLLLGSRQPSVTQINALNTRVRNIATQVTNITETTKHRLQQTVAKSIREGKTVFQVADEVRARIPEIGTNRVPTIVRTEMGRAADAGTKMAMKDSEVVTHMSVVGCEGIEKNGPHFGGIPTCNIQNFLVEEEEELDFHPNHSGTFIVSGFRNEDGSVNDYPLRAGGPYTR